MLARLSCLAWLLAGAGAPGVARAYSTPDAYAEGAYQGGGGGRWFTGSPADGLGCGACHSPAPGQQTYPFYVTGLPANTGYARGAQHVVVLSWPEYAARWSQLRPNPAAPRIPGAALPAVGLTAELVAESGKASGTIEIASATATPAELCEQTRPNLQPRLGARLYQVRPGVPARLVRPDAAGVLRCKSGQLGQRCIVALSSCGARELRFTWTAPPTWEGPIWFSAGFVATEALSGTFEQDSVDEITVPLVPRGTSGGDYNQRLRSGCALFAPRLPSSRQGPLDARRPLLAFGLVAIVGLLARRRFVRARERS
ncbi:MAG TPA: hypothetical protein VK509_01985 [Polyangiales bacterium]|nr:hypothetical protein [Polyangiales bacterium]